MFNIIPLILIVISLVVIIAIVVKKFPLLANLNVESIPAEREAKFKEQIISNRLKRNFYKNYAKVVRFVIPAGKMAGDFFKWVYKKLVDFKENYNKEKMVEVDSEKLVERLFSEADELSKKDDLDGAEKKLIEIIGLDSKNIKAFKKIGRIYLDKKNYNEAKQTLRHVLKLIEVEQKIEEGERRSVDKDQLNNLLADTYFDLALTDRAMDDFDGALANLDQALGIKNNNPRYLDTKLEISIIKKDKALALNIYDELLKADPDNQKLGELKKQIDEITE